MLQMPGVSLACADFAFALAAICHWQGRIVCHNCILYRISVDQTCQPLRISRTLYGFFIILRAYGRKSVSLQIFVFKKQIFFSILYAKFMRNCSMIAKNDRTISVLLL